MKVLFDHPMPFSLAHGGFQIQIEQSKAALERAGVNVEYLRWWDDGQKADLIHYFGRPSAQYVEHAHGKGMKVVISELLTETGSRSLAQRYLQKILIRINKAILPKQFTARLAWDSFLLADACVALTRWEAHLLMQIFDVSAKSIHVVPNGVEEEFFSSSPQPRGKWLVCTATITERKRVLETAEAAVLAKTPLWIIGKPYAEDSEYAKKFFALIKHHPDLLRYEGAIADRHKLAKMYRQAHGFVLLSTIESLSLSALEAAACECPLLLSDLPWAHGYFSQNARYCPVSASTRRTATRLRQFYEEAPHLPLAPTPKPWSEIVSELRLVYEAALSTSR